jgi:cell division protein FtsW
MHNRETYWPDKIFLALSVLLVVAGIFVFTSASFGLSSERATWESVLFSQLVLGLGVGTLLGTIATFIPRAWLRRGAFYLLGVSVVINGLLFVPGVGFSAGGATRWIHLVGISFQPSELLKVALVIFLAAWLSRIKEDARDLKYGLLPFLGLMVLVAGLMLAQPDTGTLMVMLATAFVMYFYAGAKKAHLGGLVVATVLLLLVLVMTRPYVRSRVVVFIDPKHDPSGESYQIQQSLLAVGSGSLSGRGFGQSIQKFSYLPEPMGDSIFAVLAEEFGFVGTTSVILLFIGYCLRGLRIASRAPQNFDRLLASGLVIMICIQAFMHIGATVGLVPFTGIPLPFVSHGGTALMFTLISTGLVLNVSRGYKSA